MNREILVDARWLEPPEPMEQVLMAMESLLPGQRIRFLLHREPHPLYGILQGMGFTHTTRTIEDGCFEVLIEPRSGHRS